MGSKTFFPPRLASFPTNALSTYGRLEGTQESNPSRETGNRVPSVDVHGASWHGSTRMRLRLGDGQDVSRQAPGWGTRGISAGSGRPTPESRKKVETVLQDPGSQGLGTGPFALSQQLCWRAPLWRQPGRTALLF